MACVICQERPDLRRTLKPGTIPGEAHNLLNHTEFAQMAWETGLTKADNPDEWSEMKRLFR